MVPDPFDPSWHQASVAALKQEAEAAGSTYSVITEEQARQYLRADVPYISGQFWSSGGPPGTPVTHNVQVHNPTDIPLQWGFVTDYFGLTNFAADLGAALAGRDERWGMVADGPLAIGPGAVGWARFRWTVPRVAPGVYTGNSVLWKGELHAQSEYLGRSLWWIVVPESA